MYICELYLNKAIIKSKQTNTHPEEKRSLIESLRSSRIPSISMEIRAKIRVLKDVQGRKSLALMLNIQCRRSGAYGQDCPGCKLGLNLSYRGWVPLSFCPRLAFILKAKKMTSQPREKRVSKAGNLVGCEAGPAVISPVFLTSLFHSFRMSMLDSIHHVILLV